jgi:demethylmenaquinone methyltransferase / 2-methoxy-6-polyprenyl-1,4-benzoquinol methylase
MRPFIQTDADRPSLDMNSPPEKLDWRLMRQMFWTIAPRYDFITRVFSFGMDRNWKETGVRSVHLPDNALVLDLACGTGDFARLVLRFCSGARVVALDLTDEMLRRARQRGVKAVVCGDALALPFADNAFDGIFVGYGLRNFPNLSAALREICRVTRPGGITVSLDFFLPANRLVRKLYLAWLYAQGAFWGLLLHGRHRIYTYIPHSLRAFLSIQDFSGLLQRTGYAKVESRSYISGGIGLLWAVKSRMPQAPGTKPAALHAQSCAAACSSSSPTESYPSHLPTTVKARGKSPL